MREVHKVRLQLMRETWFQNPLEFDETERLACPAFRVGDTDARLLQHLIQSDGL